MHSFSEQLKKLRQKSKMSQQELADLIGVTSASISYYEKAVRIPSGDVIIQLARIFHVTTDYILGFDDVKYLDVTDLDDTSIEMLQNTIEAMRKANKFCEKSHTSQYIYNSYIHC